MLLTFGFFFATNTILTINVILILASTIIAYQIAAKNFPEFSDKLETATTDFVTNLIAIYAMLVFSKKVIKTAIQSLRKEKSEKELQNKRLVKLLHSIQKAIEELNKSGQILKDLSDKIAERSKQQAATIEEVAASTEEISSTIGNTAELANKTHEITANAEKDIRKAAYVLDDTINIFMEISQHISVISNIAEKTDILAINAAIEAAHAGEYGKGFAIVAQEIRKLSDLAKESSSKISNLSAESREIASLTQKQTAQIVENMRDIITYMENIAVASQQQLQSINQITSSTSQLSVYAEQNIAIAEELSQAAHNLYKLSQNLNNLLNPSSAKS
jgi:methyl-accepting chemotaxis protein